jgi:pimeloyl-ACP methyl ester carboxylesterase
MEPLFEYRRRFGDFETRVLELEGEGPPVVLLHGFADSADTWRLIMAELGRAERRALAVDLPGFATAGELRRGAILPQLDGFVDAVVEHAVEDGGEAVVSGNSLGGLLSLRAAERCDRLPVAGVVPIAPAGFDKGAWFRVLERIRVLQILTEAPAPLPEAVVRTMVARVYRVVAFARPNDVDQDVVDAFTWHHRERASVARFLLTGRRLLPELEHPYQLDRIDCPVHVVWGDRDRLVSHTGIDSILAALPGTPVELIAGCGHCPQIEAADRVCELLLGFPEAHPEADAAGGRA